MLAKAELYFDLGDDAHLKISITREGPAPSATETLYNSQGVIVDVTSRQIPDDAAVKTYISEVFGKYGLFQG